MNAPSLSAAGQCGEESRLALRQFQEFPDRQLEPLAAPQSDNQIA
jgi:hypothetical protein